MTLKVMDGFDEYGGVTDLVTYGPWTSQSATALSSTVRQGSGQSLQFNADWAGVSYTFTAGNGAKTVGFAVYFNTLPASDAPICRFKNGSTSKAALYITSTGKLRTGQTSALYTGTATLTTGVWYYLEFSIYSYFSASLGRLDVYVDGTQDIDVTHDWGGASPVDFIDVVNIGTSGVTLNYLVDDAYYRNDATLLGESVVEVFEVTGDDSVVMSNQAGSGANYLHVDDPNADNDGDATYVYTNTVGEKDSYTVADMPTAAAVHAVSVVTHAKKTDTGVTTMNHGTKTGADEQQALIALGLSYDRTETIFPTYDGTNAWTEAKVNALTSTIELMS